MVNFHQEIMWQNIPQISQASPGRSLPGSELFPPIHLASCILLLQLLNKLQNTLSHLIGLWVSLTIPQYLTSQGQSNNSAIVFLAACQASSSSNCTVSTHIYAGRKLVSSPPGISKEMGRYTNGETELQILPLEQVVCTSHNKDKLY